MLTKRQVRRAVTYTGLVLGAIGLLTLILSLFGALEIASPARRRTITIGHGAIRYESSLASFPIPNSGPASPTVRFSSNAFPWFIWPSAKQGMHIVIPWWILLALGLYSAYRLLPDDHAPNLCPKCRFDLSSTPPLPDKPTHTRCPECARISPKRA